MAPKKVWRKNPPCASDEATKETKVWRKAAVASDEATKERKSDAPKGSQEADWQRCVRIDEGARQVKVEMAGWALEDDDMEEWCSWFGAHLERAAVRTAVGAPVKLTAKEIDFSENQLTSVGMSKLLDILMKHQLAVLVLKLHHNLITGVGNLSMFLAACKGTLRELHLSHNELSTSAAGQIIIAAAAVKDADGMPSYPQPVKGGESSAPFWLRLEQNCIDHKLLSEAVEPAFAELGRPGRLFCSINGRGCTPRCCMRYHDEPPAVHVKFLANQRPRPPSTEEEEAMVFEDIRKLSASMVGKSAARAQPKGKGSGRGKQRAIGASSDEKTAAAPQGAARNGAPEIAVGAARGESTRSAARVWKVKEAPTLAQAPPRAEPSFAVKALPKALQEIALNRETSELAKPPSCIESETEKLPQILCNKPPNIAESGSLDVAQGRELEPLESRAEDGIIDKVQPCESSTVSEGETRSSGELAQEGSSQSSHSGLDNMQEALVTPSETPDGSEQVPGLQAAAYFASDKEMDAALSQVGTSEGTEQATTAESENAAQPLDGLAAEKKLPEPPSKPPALDSQFREKMLPEPPSEPPALDNQPVEKMLPVPPAQPPTLESHSVEKTLPDPPAKPPTLGSLSTEKTVLATPEEPDTWLWRSMMLDDENPARKGNPTLKSSLNPAAAEFFPGKTMLLISVEASTTKPSFALNPQASTTKPSFAFDPQAPEFTPSKPSMSSSAAAETCETSSAAPASTSQQAVKDSALEDSARAVLSAIRAARAAQMRYVGSSRLLADDDESDDGLGIASAAGSSAGEETPVALREISRPRTPWQLLQEVRRAPIKMLLGFLQGSHDSSADADKGSRDVFVQRRVPQSQLHQVQAA